MAAIAIEHRRGGDAVGAQRAELDVVLIAQAGRQIEPARQNIQREIDKLSREASL